MGYIEALVIIGLLNSLLAKDPPSADVENFDDDIGGANSDLGQPIPLVFGTIQMSDPKVLWYGSSRNTANIVKSGRFFGIGGTGSRAVTGYRYYRSVQFGLCRHLDFVRKIYLGGELVWDVGIDGNVGIYPQGYDRNHLNTHRDNASGYVAFIDSHTLFGSDNGYGGDFYVMRGIDNSQPDIDINEHQNNDAFDVRYGFLATIYFADFYWGNSNTSLPNPTFELSNVYRRDDYTGDEIVGVSITDRDNLTIAGFDLNPVEVIAQLLLMDKRNVISEIDLDNFNDVGTILKTEGLGISAYITGEQTIKGMLELIAEVIDGNIFFNETTEQYQIKLFRQPSVDEIDNSLLLDDEAISMINSYEQPSYDSVFSEVRITYENRDNDYKPDIAIEQEPAVFDAVEKLNSITLDMPLIKTSEIAQRIASRELKVRSVPFIVLDLTVNRTASRLIVGDLVRITYPIYEFEEKLFRVASVNLGSDVSTAIRLRLVEETTFYNDITAIANEVESGWMETETEPLDALTEIEAVAMPSFYVRIAGILEEQENVYSRIMTLVGLEQDNLLTYDVYVDDKEGVDSVSYSFNPTASVSAIDRPVYQSAIESFEAVSSIDNDAGELEFSITSGQLTIYMTQLDSSDNDVSDNLILFENLEVVFYTTDYETVIISRATLTEKTTRNEQNIVRFVGSLRHVFVDEVEVLEDDLDLSDYLGESFSIKLSNTITTTGATLSTGLLGNTDFVDGLSVGVIENADNDLIEFVGWRFEVSNKLYAVERGLFYTTPKAHNADSNMFAFGNVDLDDEKKLKFSYTTELSDDYINAPVYSIRYTGEFTTGESLLDNATELTSKAQRNITNISSGIYAEPAKDLLINGFGEGAEIDTGSDIEITWKHSNSSTLLQDSIKLQSDDSDSENSLVSYRLRIFNDATVVRTEALTGDNYTWESDDQDSDLGTLTEDTTLRLELDTYGIDGSNSELIDTYLLEFEYLV